MFSARNKFLFKSHFFNYVHKNVKLHEHSQFGDKKVQ